MRTILLRFKVLNILIVLTIILSYRVYSQSTYSDIVLNNYNDPLLIIIKEDTNKFRFAINNITRKAVDLPEWIPALNKSSCENHIIMHNPATLTEKKIEFDITKINLKNKIDKYNSKHEFEESSGFSDLERVSFNFPFSDFNVKLFIHFPDFPPDMWSEGSGFIIDPRYVLTAAHCVFSHSFGGWADTVIVAPAYENGNFPYGGFRERNLVAWTNWINNRDWDWDLGIIELNRPIAMDVSKVFIDPRNNSNWANFIFINCGYPAAYPYDGEYLYRWSG